MSLEQNKEVVLDALRVLETGDSAAADRIIAPDFINREADDDPNRPDRGLRGPASLIATSRWLSGWVSDLRFDHHEVVAEDERVVVVATMTGTHTGTLHGIPQRANGFSSASFIYFGCVPDKLWSIRHCGMISACCINSAERRPRPTRKLYSSRASPRSCSIPTTS